MPLSPQLKTQDLTEKALSLISSGALVFIMDLKSGGIMKKGLFKFLVTILIAVISISAVPVSIYAADSDFEIVLNVGGKTGYIQKYNGTEENREYYITKPRCFNNSEV